MHTVLAVVCHAACIQRLNAYVFILCSIVRQCKAERVHVCKILAADCDYDLLTGFVALLVGCDCEATGYSVLWSLVYAFAYVCCCNRYVICIDEAVLVDVAYAYIVEVAVAFV